MNYNLWKLKTLTKHFKEKKLSAKVFVTGFLFTMIRKCILILFIYHQYIITTVSVTAKEVKYKTRIVSFKHIRLHLQPLVNYSELLILCCSSWCTSVLLMWLFAWKQRKPVEITTNLCAYSHLKKKKVLKIKKPNPAYWSVSSFHFSLIMGQIKPQWTVNYNFI